MILPTFLNNFSLKILWLDNLFFIFANEKMY